MPDFFFFDEFAIFKSFLVGFGFVAFSWVLNSIVLAFVENLVGILAFFVNNNLVAIVWNIADKFRNSLDCYTVWNSTTASS